MKKILSEGLLVGFFLLIGVSYAQNFNFNTNDISFPLSKNSQIILDKRLSKLNGFESNANLKLKKSNGQIPFLADTVIVTGTEKNYRYSYTYDSKGKVKTQLKEVLKNNKYENLELENYSFDYDNNVETFKVHKWENNEWKMIAMYIRTYDSKGNEIQSIFYSNYPDGIWKPDCRVTISYHFGKTYSCILEEIYHKGRWNNSYRMIQIIDEKFLRTTDLIQEKWTNDKWNIVENSAHYDYDALSDTTAITTKIWKDNNWINHELEKYYANPENGNRTAILYEWNENNWDLDLKWYLTYNNNGTEVISTSEYWLNNKCESISKRTSLYDLNGDILAFIEELYKNGQWSNISKENYAYDENGNVEKFEARNWINSTWQPGNSGYGLQYLHDSFWGSDVSLHYKPLDQFVDVESEKLPSGFELSQNYPNPFNPETTIGYKVQAASQVSLKVFDVLGREVATLVDEHKQPGVYHSQFSICNYQLTSGVYFYRLQSGNFTSTKKMVLLQ